MNDVIGYRLILFDDIFNTLESQMRMILFIHLINLFQVVVMRTSHFLLLHVLWKVGRLRIPKWMFLQLQLRYVIAHIQTFYDLLLSSHQLIIIFYELSTTYKWCNGLILNILLLDYHLDCLPEHQ